MKKIPSLFIRDMATKHIINEINPGCEWVIRGEGIATRKWNGMACMVKDRILYKRYDAKHGKTPPKGFIECQEADPITGHWPGWIKVDYGKSENKYFRELLPTVEFPTDFEYFSKIDDVWHTKYINHGIPYEDGTYEFCGPKVQGNAEGYPLDGRHTLKRHGDINLRVIDLLVKSGGDLSFFEKVKDWFERGLKGAKRAAEEGLVLDVCKHLTLEGIVWHHPDGRMAKIKRKDFSNLSSQEPVSVSQKLE